MKKSAVCGIIVGDEILLLKRLPRKDKSNGWCIPGGKADGDETPQACAERELWEETCIEGKKPRYVGKEKSGNGEYMVHVHYLVLPSKPGVHINYFEHSEHVWAKISELKRYALAGNTQKFIDLILKDLAKNS